MNFNDKIICHILSISKKRILELYWTYLSVVTTFGTTRGVD